EINRDVPKFLNEMKATMPAYLLRTTDENAVISSISKDWAGGLPFSVLYNKDGEIVHFKQGKIKIDVVKEKLNSLLSNSEEHESFLKGKKDALDDLSNGNLILRNYGCKSGTVNKSDLSRRRGVFIFGELTEPKPKSDENELKFELECKANASFQEIRYMEGYNSISQPEIMKVMDIAFFRFRQFGFPINYPPKIIEVILTKK
ncbi:MAG: TlpA family protein disulfide reductase, partial [Aridibacter sp.]